MSACPRCAAIYCRHQPFIRALSRDRYPARKRPPINGDKVQAQQRVPKPSLLPCADCGQRWAPGLPRHEYDHHLGYAPEHHECVETVCRACHNERERARRAG